MRYLCKLQRTHSSFAGEGASHQSTHPTSGELGQIHGKVACRLWWGALLRHLCSIAETLRVPRDGSILSAAVEDGDTGSVQSFQHLSGGWPLAQNEQRGYKDVRLPTVDESVLAWAGG